jgi:hypothetical protein
MHKINDGFQMQEQNHKRETKNIEIYLTSEGFSLSRFIKNFGVTLCGGINIVESELKVFNKKMRSRKRILFLSLSRFLISNLSINERLKQSI